MVSVIDFRLFDFQIIAFFIMESAVEFTPFRCINQPLPFVRPPCTANTFNDVHQSNHCVFQPFICIHLLCDR